MLFGSFFDYSVEAFPDWVWGTFMMIRKDLINLLPGGKLNDDYFMYCEDIQWCMDFRKTGFRTMFTPQASVVHLMGGSSADKKALIKSNFEKFLDKNYGRLHAWLLKLIYRYYY
jgi:GT2 family glycosyltransferase